MPITIVELQSVLNNMAQAIALYNSGQVPPDVHFAADVMRALIKELKIERCVVIEIPEYADRTPPDYREVKNILQKLATSEKSQHSQILVKQDWHYIALDVRTSKTENSVLILDAASDPRAELLAHAIKEIPSFMHRTGETPRVLLPGFNDNDPMGVIQRDTFSCSLHVLLMLQQAKGIATLHTDIRAQDRYGRPSWQNTNIHLCLGAQIEVKKFEAALSLRLGSEKDPTLKAQLSQDINDVRQQMTFEAVLPRVKLLDNSGKPLKVENKPIYKTAKEPIQANTYVHSVYFPVVNQVLARLMTDTNALSEASVRIPPETVLELPKSLAKHDEGFVRSSTPSSTLNRFPARKEALAAISEDEETTPGDKKVENLAIRSNNDFKSRFNAARVGGEKTNSKLSPLAEEETEQTKTTPKM